MILLGTLTGVGTSTAQPIPGEVFREYTWFNKGGDAGQALRVGGKWGREHPDRGWAYDYINAPVVLTHSFDLQHAVKAEVVIEKILCHDGTTGLAIQVNESEWFYAPEAAHIPAPQAEYQHHFYPILRLPLSVFKHGTNNRFRMRVDPNQSWKWPQNLINGVHFRIYYDAEKKVHLKGEMIAPQSGDTLGRTVVLNAQYEPSHPTSESLDAAQATPPKIKQIDYIGLYEDVNYEGDGVYRQWHYRYDHGQLVNHLGSASSPTGRVSWDTSWVPDQREPMQIVARIVDQTGITYLTPPITDLLLQRPKLKVELCKPYAIPQKWATRMGEKSELFDIRGNLSQAKAAQLVWSSWSPAYMRGILINDQQVFDREGRKYQAAFHRVTIDDLGAFQPGRNTLKTGMTPRINGKMVHGMEVNWPGIMVLIQYQP